MIVPGSKGCSRTCREAPTVKKEKQGNIPVFLCPLLPVCTVSYNQCQALFSDRLSKNLTRDALYRSVIWLLWINVVHSGHLGCGVKVPHILGIDRGIFLEDRT